MILLYLIVATEPTAPPSGVVKLTESQTNQFLIEDIQRLNFENQRNLSLLNEYQNFNLEPLNDNSNHLNNIIREREMLIESQKKKIDFYKNQLEVIL